MNLQRLKTLIDKERRQLWRDKSSIVIGLLVPIVLLLIFGYGMSLDIKNIKLAIVEPETSSMATKLIAKFTSSDYFTVTQVRSTEEGNELVRTHEVDACLFIPQQLPRKVADGTAEFLVVVNGTNGSQARLMDSYIESILTTFFAKENVNSRKEVRMVSRMWFNDANDSTYFMVPGVIVIIMSLIGTKLTSMLMAKEYEYGNMESMFATPMTAGELLLAKIINNFVLGMMGLAISLIFARYLFGVPIRGSLLILVIGSGTYLLMALAVGLLLSSLTKSQFIASQLSMMLSFMPVFLLSGFIYEIPNMPKVIQYITWIVPARYYIDFLQTILLVGNVWGNIFFNIGIILAFTVGLLILAVRYNPKLLGK